MIDTSDEAMRKKVSNLDKPGMRMSTFETMLSDLTKSNHSELATTLTSLIRSAQKYAIAQDRFSNDEDHSKWIVEKFCQWLHAFSAGDESFRLSIEAMKGCSNYIHTHPDVDMDGQNLMLQCLSVKHYVDYTMDRAKFSANATMLVLSETLTSVFSTNNTLAFKRTLPAFFQSKAIQEKQQLERRKLTKLLSGWTYANHQEFASDPNLMNYEMSGLQSTSNSSRSHLIDLVSKHTEDDPIVPKPQSSSQMIEKTNESNTEAGNTSKGDEKQAFNEDDSVVKPSSKDSEDITNEIAKQLIETLGEEEFEGEESEGEESEGDSSGQSGQCESE